MRINTTLFGGLNLLTHCPLVGAVETYDFLTAINESFNGIEERTPLRDKPKQQFSIDFSNLSTDFIEQYVDIRRKWAVPFNQEIQYVGTASGDMIACDVNASDFRADSLALIKSGNDIRIAEIEEVLEDGLKLYGAIDEIQDATITPLKVCVIDGDIQRNFKLTHVMNAVKFLVIDVNEIVEEVPTQFKDKDIYFLEFREVGASFNSSISKQQDLIDYEIGLFSTRTRWNNARFMRDWNVVFKTRAELFKFKKFLFRRLGKYREFWLPTNERNLILKNTGNITTTVDVELINMNWRDRKNLAFKVNGEWLARTATTVSTVNGNTRFVLDQPLNVNSSDVELISYLGLYRLNTDTIDIDFLGNGVAKSSLSLVELNG